MRRLPGPIGLNPNAERPDNGTLAITRHHASGVGLEFAMSLETRVGRVLAYTVALLPGDMRDEGRALLTPQSIAAVAAMFAVSLGAQLTPFGWVADAAMFCLGAAALGTSVFQVTRDLRAFAAEFASAETDDDLRRAARHLARVLAVIGVGTLLLWLTKRGASIALSASEVLAAARSVVLDTAGREVAFWSGVNPDQIPRQFATLERMLSETSAGQQLAQVLKRGGFQKFKSAWFELSERTATLGADSGKEVHYFVSADRGYYKALYPAEAALREWWTLERPKLIESTRARLTTQGKTAAEVEREVAAQEQRLSRWTKDEIEAQYYADKRRSPHNPHAIEDEVFHKLEKLQLRGAWVHELNSNGAEIRKWWQEF